LTKSTAVHKAFHVEAAIRKHPHVLLHIYKPSFAMVHHVAVATHNLAGKLAPVPLSAAATDGDEASFALCRAFALGVGASLLLIAKEPPCSISIKPSCGPVPLIAIVTQNLAGKLAPVLSSGLAAATDGGEASFALCRAFARGVGASLLLIANEPPCSISIKPSFMCVPRIAVATQNHAGKLAPVLSSGLAAATDGDEATLALCRAFALGVGALLLLIAKEPPCSISIKSSCLLVPRIAFATQNLAGKLAPVLSSCLAAATNGDEASFALCRAFARGVGASLLLIAKEPASSN
jgi:hypothetical protein